MADYKSGKACACPGLVEHGPELVPECFGKVGEEVKPVPAGLPAGAGNTGRTLRYCNLLGRLLGVRAFGQGNDQDAFDLPGADTGLVDLPV